MDKDNTKNPSDPSWVPEPDPGQARVAGQGTDLSPDLGACDRRMSGRRPFRREQMGLTNLPDEDEPGVGFELYTNN